MSTFRLLLAEIGYRKLNFALAVLAVAVAVSLFVAGPVLIDGYSRQSQAEMASLEEQVAESARRLAQAERQSAEELALLEDETRKVMRDLGFNLMLVHRDTDIVEFLGNRVPTIDMPQEFAQRLAADKRLTLVTHLVATLKGKLAWEGRDVYLVGYQPEVPQSHKQHEKPMGYVVEPGTVFLGHRLGNDREVGQSIELGGKSFRIAQILPEQGTEEDITITLHLGDAQALLDKSGRINLILALECKCVEGMLPEIRKQVGRTLPETQVLRDTSKADARSRQRMLVGEKHQQIVARQKESLAERQRVLDETAARRQKVQRLMELLLGTVTPLVVLAMAAWVALLAMANVRERRTEIGVLRALGKGSGMIARLFLGKAVVLGLAGAAAGCLCGTAVARLIATQSLAVAPDYVLVRPDLLAAALVGAPLVAALASYLPTLSALLQDPAVALRDQ